MDEKEVTRKLGEPVVVCKYPDVCLSPTAPAPYLITASFTDAQSTADTVNATKVPTFTMASFIPGVLGDEAGTGCGMKSGTHAANGVCWPTGASSTVKAKKSFVVRHDDPFMMNNGNVPGLVNYPKGSAPRAAVNDAGEPSALTKPLNIVADTPVEGGFFTGLGQSLTETYEGVTGQVGTLWDATGITSTAEDALKARTAIANGAANLGGLAKDAALTVTVPFYETEEGLLALARMADRETAIADAVVDRYDTAIAEGGQGHATGLLFGDLLQAVVGAAAGAALKSARGAGAVAALENAGDVVGATAKTEKVLDAAGGIAKVDVPSLPKGGLPDAPSLPKGVPEGPGLPKGALSDGPGKVPGSGVLDEAVELNKVGPDGARIKVTKKDLLESHNARRAALTDAEKAEIAADKAKISELAAQGKIDEARAILEPHVAKGDTFAIIERLDVSTELDKGFLWSGDLEAAKAIAGARGGSVLETTLGGRVVNGWDALNDKFSVGEFWGPLSDKYASQLEGLVTNIQDYAKALKGGGRTFLGFELPQLQLGQFDGRITGYERIVLPKP
jgi:hypothetical protein